jgi:hypothetical protein
MAGLGLGMPIVTTVGRLSDMVFHDTDAVRVAADSTPLQMATIADELLNDPSQRQRLRDASTRFYDRYCSVECVVRRMRAHL